jgi:predicted nuclease of restriction endonuclease-like (RecB) superfamily
MIVEDEQQGQHRAEYGKQVLKELSQRLATYFGKGFSERNLEQMRKFYLVYSISQKTSAELQSPQFQLSWSRYLKLMRMQNVQERRFYEIESFKNGWSLKELQRQFDSALYQRLALSRDKAEVKRLSQQGQVLEKPIDAVKDPYILEFLGLPEQSCYSESKLEQVLFDKLEHFLLELGQGFTFVGRQVRFTFDEKHFRVDLVFYNRLLRCFVLIDLKISELTHQDLGQMQMYVNYYDRFVLCRKK